MEIIFPELDLPLLNSLETIQTKPAKIKPLTIVEINFGPEALTAYLFLGNQLNPTLKPHINRKSDPKMKASTLICLSLTATTSKQRRFLLQILYEKASSALFQGYPL